MKAKQYQLQYGDGGVEETREEQVKRYFAGTKKNTGKNKLGNTLSEKAGVQSPLVSWFREVVKPMYEGKEQKPILIVNPFADMSFAPREWFEELNKLKYPEEKAIYWKKIKGHNVSIVNAAKAQGFEKSNPDFIMVYRTEQYTGLAMELKKEGEKVTKRDGSYKSEHLQLQWERIKEFRSNGYQAYFVFGYQAAKRQVCEYLGIKYIG